MVYTVTLNPALDYVVRLPRLTPGALNRTESEELQFGGKGINVAVVLRRLGVDAVALGFAAGFTGEAIRAAVEAAGVPTDFVFLPAGCSRINVKLKSERETEINAAGPAVPPEAAAALLEKLDALTDGDALVLAGSLPPGLPDDCYRRMLERLAGRDVLTVVDAAGPLLRSVLPCRPFLVKPNREELGGLFGVHPQSDAEVADCAARLQAEDARNVLVSLAGDGALLLTEDGALRRVPAARGRVRNSVGAGDSMVAGFLAGYLPKHDFDRALRLGSAAGGATAFHDALATAEEIREVFDFLDDISS